MIDHPALHAIQEHLTKNAEAYIAAVGALFVAGVCAMPAKIPGSIQEFWTWLRDSLQIAVPAARATHITQTVETPQLKVTTTSDPTDLPKETTK